jgi:hypothetical protein
VIDPQRIRRKFRKSSAQAAGEWQQGRGRIAVRSCYSKRNGSKIARTGDPTHQGHSKTLLWVEVVGNTRKCRTDTQRKACAAPAISQTCSVKSSQSKIAREGTLERPSKIRKTQHQRFQRIFRKSSAKAAGDWRKRDSIAVALPGPFFFPHVRGNKLV